jgi:glucose/mannose-6-phosphate isomerase
MKHLLPLLSFKKQFLFEPKIQNHHEGRYDSVVLIGMGGSLISGLLLKQLFPSLNLEVHNDYGIPHHPKGKSILYICNSYSGNTEEVLDAYTQLTKQQLPVAVITCGGKLGGLSNTHAVPHIILPQEGLEPRFAVGYQMIAILSLMKEEKLVSILRHAASEISLPEADAVGKKLSQALYDKTVILYSSRRNYPLAYTTKAAINEGAKSLAFVNTFSEANHNELESFSNLSSFQKHHLAVLFFKDDEDHPRIKERMSICKKLFTEMGIKTVSFKVSTATETGILTSLLAGYYTSTYLALHYHVEPYKTALIAKFKEELGQ